MAYKKISDLVAVVAPQDTDLILVEQGDIVKRETRAQVVASEAATRAAADTTLTTNLNNESVTRAAGDVTLQSNITAEAATRATDDLLRVLKAGDTMTGALVLPAAAPTLGTHATNKTYVDDNDLLRASRTEDFTPAGTFPTTWGGTAIEDGQRFRIDTAGTITSSDAVTYNLLIGDILEALVNTPAQLSTNWTIQARLVQPATETVSGRAEIATDAETLAVTDDTRIVSPLKLGNYLDTVTYAEQEVNASPVVVLATAPRVFFVHTAAAAITFTLPSIATIGASLVQKYRLVILDIDGSAWGNNVTINTSGGNTINGVPSIRLNNNYFSVMLIPRGTTWAVVFNESYRDAQNVTYVNLGGVQNVPASAETRIDFNAVNGGYNPFSQFVIIAPFTYTPLYSGIYHVSLQAHVDFVASHGLSLRIKQGANVIAAHDYVTPAITTGANGNRYLLDTIVAMSAATAYDFYTWQNSGAGLNFNSGANGTRLIIKCISL